MRYATILVVLASFPPATLAPVSAQEWSFVRGDFNGDSTLALADAINLLNYLFVSGTEPPCFDAIDVNDDGATGLADPVNLLNYLFASGPAPAAPFPGCGEDPTPDGLDCVGPLAGCPPAALPPTITSAPFTVASVEVPYVYDVEAIDPEMEVLTYTLEAAPSGAVIDMATGLITWTPMMGQEGSHPFTVRVASESGLFSEQSYVVEVQPWPAPPTIDPIMSPTDSTTVTVAGSATTAAQVEVSGGVEIMTVPVTAGVYSASVVLHPNFVNILHARAINASGQASAPTTVCVIQDQQAPGLFIDFPAEDQQLLEPEVIAGGRVSDMLSGFMGITVTVNGTATIVEPGIGTNGTYQTVAPIPLTLGANTLTAVATDEVGNVATVTSTVIRVAPDPTLPQMQIIGGNDQTAMIQTDVAVPIAVQLNDSDGSPFGNKLVTFRVTRSNGGVRAVGADPADGALVFQTFTDGSGQAQALWRLGSDAGCGNNRVTVSSNGIEGTLRFCASATEGLPIQINVGSGNNQRGEVGSPAAMPLVAWVSDSCNGVSDVPVTFTIVRGNGLVNGQSQAVVLTGLTGHAPVEFTLGSEPGVNIVEAITAMNQGGPAYFVITGIVRDETQPTRFSGRLLSNAGEPIGTASCLLTVGDNPPVFTITSSDGMFHFDDVPGSGAADLYVHGVSAMLLGGLPIPTGSFPSLHFEMFVTPNAKNALSEAVLLPPLNTSNAVPYSTTDDTVLTVEGIAGLRMIIAAGSMRYPSGAPAEDGAMVALNVVHTDDIPMPMPDGANPPLAWTLQPGGSTFDPPVGIEFPNMSGLSAGAVAYFLTFNHATGMFEIFGSGSVTDDGSTVVTDPGAGLTLAGWGSVCPPYSVEEKVEQCSINCTPGGIGGGTVAVNIPNPVYGEIVTFTAEGVMASGGNIVVTCSCGTGSENPLDPPAVFYTWVAVKPSGSTLTGTGPTAFIECDECGEFVCTFTAGAAGACVPPPITVGSASALVEGPEPGDSVPLSDLNPDLSAINTALGILANIGGLFPCTVPPPNLSLSISREQFEQCCDDGQLHPLERWNGSGGGTLGFSCSFPIPIVPPLLSASVDLGVSGMVDVMVEDEQTCTDSELCGQVVIAGNGNAGASLDVGPGGILGSAQGVVVVSFGGQAEVCFAGGAPTFSGEFCVGQVDLIGTVTLLTFEVASINTTIYEGECNPI